MVNKPNKEEAENKANRNTNLDHELMFKLISKSTKLSMNVKQLCKSPTETQRSTYKAACIRECQTLMNILERVDVPTTTETKSYRDALFSHGKNPQNMNVHLSTQNNQLKSDTTPMTTKGAVPREELVRKGIPTKTEWKSKKFSLRNFIQVKGGRNLKKKEEKVRMTNFIDAVHDKEEIRSKIRDKVGKKLTSFLTTKGLVPIALFENTANLLDQKIVVYNLVWRSAREFGKKNVNSLDDVIFLYHGKEGFGRVQFVPESDNKVSLPSDTNQPIPFPWVFGVPAKVTDPIQPKSPVELAQKNDCSQSTLSMDQRKNPTQTLDILDVPPQQDPIQQDGKNEEVNILGSLLTDSQELKESTQEELQHPNECSSLPRDAQSVPDEYDEILSPPSGYEYVVKETEPIEESGDENLTPNDNPEINNGRITRSKSLIIRIFVPEEQKSILVFVNPDYIDKNFDTVFVDGDGRCGFTSEAIIQGVKHPTGKVVPSEWIDHKRRKISPFFKIYGKAIYGETKLYNARCITFDPNNITHDLNLPREFWYCLYDAVFFCHLYQTTLIVFYYVEYIPKENGNHIPVPENQEPYFIVTYCEKFKKNGIRYMHLKNDHYTPLFLKKGRIPPLEAEDPDINIYN